MKHRRLQTQPLYWQSAPKVDREAGEAGMIYGAVSMTADTEALGHGIMTDTRSLEIALQLANEHRGGLGIQGRFGHPGASENSAGRKFMLSKNFRLGQAQGKLALLHDIEFMSSARVSPAFSGDVVEYVTQVAETQPGEIAESFVMNTDAVWIMPDGSELDADDDAAWPPDTARDPEDRSWVQRPLYASTPLPIMRPVQLAYLDMVNEGALTHQGLFDSAQAAELFSGTSSTYAQELFEYIDQFRQEYNIPLAALPDKLDSILGRYLASRSKTMPAGQAAKKPTAKAAVQAQARPAATSGVSEATIHLAALDGEPISGTPVEVSAPPMVDEQAEVETVEADPLDEAEQTADVNDDVINPPVVEQPQAVGVAAEQLAALEQRVERLVALVVRQGKQLNAALTRLAAMEGEPIVTARVPKFGTQRVSMERGNGKASRQQHATPPHSLQAGTPRGFESRPAVAQQSAVANGNMRPLSEADQAAQAVLEAQQRRQAARS